MCKLQLLKYIHISTYCAMLVGNTTYLDRRWYVQCRLTFYSKRNNQI